MGFFFFHLPDLRSPVALADFLNSQTCKLKLSKSVALKLSPTSSSRGAPKRHGCRKKKRWTAEPVLFSQHFRGPKENAEGQFWQSCGRLIYCTLCGDKASCLMLGSFILEVALKCFPIPLIVPRKIN